MLKLFLFSVSLLFLSSVFSGCVDKEKRLMIASSGYTGCEVNNNKISDIIIDSSFGGGGTASWKVQCKDKLHICSITSTGYQHIVNCTEVKK